MRLKEKRFSIPFCIFRDDLSGEQFRFLCYLFSRSDFSGASKLRYDDIKRDTGIGSEHTISTSFRHLEKLGWIFHRKKTRDGQTIWLQIPPRHRHLKDRDNPILKLHKVQF